MARSRVGALAVVLALVLASGAHAQGARPTGLTKVRAAVLPFLSYAPFFIATDEGYFAQQGLDVEFVRFTRSADAVVALVQGQIDVAGSIMTVNMLSAVARHARLKIVASRSHVAPAGCVYTALVARRALLERRGWGDPAQLNGLRIAMSEVNLEGLYVEKLLQPAGLTLRDVRMQELPDPAMPGVLEKDAVDVVATSEPWLTRLVQSGHGAVWMPVQRLVPDSEFGLLLYGTTFLDKDPDAGKRFVTAYLKAVRQYSQGKTERNLEIVARHTKLDLPLLRDACWPPFRETGQINTQSVLEFQAWALRRGLVERTLGADDFWDSRFVEHANRVLGPAGPAR
jgi:NitT/TauT family transport system substrate-binding protein